jgi:hypothetical protein
MRGEEDYGTVFVVKTPIEQDDLGCLLSLIIPRSGIDFINNSSNYASMINVTQSINNSRKRGKSYWPDYSLVGGFTTERFGRTYNDEWLRILASVISEYR